MDAPHAPSSNDPSWLLIRDKLVHQAIQENDVELLRRLAALPGGFGSDAARRAAWLFLLHAETGSLYAEDDPVDEQAQVAKASVQSGQTEGPETHKDEEQVGRDTARAFVTYPTDTPRESKEALKADLHDLIVGVLRQRPGLSYFQGYHDILSVLYLTFVPPRPPPPRTRSRSTSRAARKAATDGITPPATRPPSPKPRLTEEEPLGPSRDTREWRDLRRCAEAISLLRVRDAMGSGMEGMMGLLRLLKRILRAADPDLARFSAHISPVPTLPFFALSWILCLFSHDVDSLAPVQRMFDYLLSRNPVSAVYLAVAILIAKKPQMLKLAKELGQEAADDPTLLHPLFSRLPPLRADIPDTPISITPASRSAKKGDEEQEKSQQRKHFEGEPDRDEVDDNPYDPIPLSEVFALADDLMLRYPWDGPIIRGRDLMGPGSVLCTYDMEGEMSWDEAEKMVDQDVVNEVPESEDEAEPDISNIRKGRSGKRVNKLGTAIAVSVLIVGMGLAVYGGRYHVGAWRELWRRWPVGVLFSRSPKVHGLIEGWLQRLRGLAPR